jgi:hypothetical protein
MGVDGIKDKGVGPEVQGFVSGIRFYLGRVCLLGSAELSFPYHFSDSNATILFLKSVNEHISYDS